MSGGPGAPEDPVVGDPRDLRAAEYVLGTLPADEREEFARALGGDADVQASVRAWERRLGPLGLAIPDVTPPDSVWQAIARAVPGPSHDVANDNRLQAVTAQLRRWRLATGAAGLVAAGLAAAMVLGPKGIEPPQPSGARYVAVVTSGGALPALIVSVDTAAGTAQVRPVKAETPSDRSLQLWYVGSDKTPKPLGLIGAQTSRVNLPEGARGGEGVFAVSVEPPGGSPTGQPTGQVVYTGQLIRD